MKRTTKVSGLAVAITTAFLAQLFGAMPSLAEAPTATPTPAPALGAAPPKPLSKVCVNLQSGNVAVKTECSRVTNPSAPRVEAEVPVGTTNLGPRAYGYVAWNGVIDKSRSSANVSARKINKQVYCVRAVGLDSRTSPMPVTSVDFSTSECPDKPVLPMSRTINSGCKLDEFAFILLGCHHDPEPGMTYEDANSFSFIIP